MILSSHSLDSFTSITEIIITLIILVQSSFYPCPEAGFLMRYWMIELHVSVYFFPKLFLTCKSSFAQILFFPKIFLSKSQFYCEVLFSVSDPKRVIGNAFTFYVLLFLRCNSSVPSFTLAIQYFVAPVSFETCSNLT